MEISSHKEGNCIVLLSSLIISKCIYANFAVFNLGIHLIKNNACSILRKTPRDSDLLFYYPFSETKITSREEGEVGGGFWFVHVFSSCKLKLSFCKVSGSASLGKLGSSQDRTSYCSRTEYWVR